MGDKQIYPEALHEALINFHSHGLVADSWQRAEYLCLNGKWDLVEYALSMKDANYWKGVNGRKALRLMASVACVNKHKHIASRLILDHNVPLNTIPADELALVKQDDPKLLYHNSNATPFLTCILAGNEDFALYLLSLKPNEDLDLNRLVGTTYYKTLHRVADAGMARLMQVLLR
jgi:hypothetical protein